MTTRAATDTDLTRFYELFPQPALARDLFNIVEGHRVDAAIRRAYPGIRRDMALIQAASAERRPELATLSDSQAVVEALLQHTLGLTVFMITHDLDTLYTITDRVAVIAEKHVVATAPVTELEKSDHPWIQSYFKGPRGRAAQAARQRNEGTS